jgi:hypothetical protein
VFAMFLLVSCAKQESAPAPSDLPHASVLLRDGTQATGTGALGEVLTKGSAIRLPAETVMTFQLDQPLRVVERK